MLKKLLSLAFVASLGLGVMAGCEKSTEEEAEEAANNATEAVENAAEEAGDAAQEAGNAIEDATD